ncbi:MAG: hypothetical protein R3214_15455 [Christiangramia sp.]|nr:hypothetical protein [Christiangramia sp.]
MRTSGIFIFLLLSIINKNIAQEREYIVTRENDTVYGKITRGINYFNTAEVKYNIRDEKGDKSSIDPGEIAMIRSYDGVDGDCVIVPVYDRWYIKRIIDGEIKVYQLVDGIPFFISKNGSELKSVDFGGLNSRKEAHTQIRPLIEDKPLILEEFDSMQGSQKNILYIIQKYNDSDSIN